MDETTTKTLADIRDGLFSLARAHRNVIPPSEMTAGQLAEWGAALSKILDAQPQPVKRAPGVNSDGWHITVTYSDGEEVTDTAPGLHALVEVLTKHTNSEHGDMERVVMV